MDPELLRLLGIVPADATRTPRPRPQPVITAAPRRGMLPPPTERTGLPRMVEDVGNLVVGDDLRKLLTRGKMSKGAMLDLAMTLPIGKLAKAARMANPEIRALAEPFIHADVPLVPATKAAVERTGPKIAEWYGSFASNAADPATVEAYRALARESQAQLDAMRRAGIDVQYVKQDPYTSSAEMMADVRDNKRLKIFASTEGGHPLLSPDENNVFRAVHDFFGHAMEGHQFGPLGEERAFREHMRMFSPEARRAMAVETRGQNSFVNFGPDAAWNRANPAQTRYAPQKVGLMPEEFMQMSSGSALDDFMRALDRAPEPDMLVNINGVLHRIPQGYGAPRRY